MPTANPDTDSTLLLVDDEPNILSALRRVFIPLGYRVLTANSGGEGLEILRREMVDLILCDMRMPYMDGAHFLTEAYQLRPDAARLLLTGHSDLESAIAAINDGRISRYITKPWDNDELLNVIRSSLAERQRPTLKPLPPPRATLLVADDDPLYLKWLQEVLSQAGFAVVSARNGNEAIQFLEQEPLRFDLVILDRLMPECGGLEALAMLRQTSLSQALPVIIHSSMCSADEQFAGKVAGAYSYLVKPCRPELLISLVEVAVRDYRRYRASLQELTNCQRWLGFLHSGEFRVKTLAEVEALGTMLAHLCPDPERTFYGLAEVLRNAVEHGNLGISYAEKSKLHQSNTLSEEILRRQALPENADKRVLVRFVREPSQISFEVIDEGPGFDWQPFLDFSPERLLHTHGRGIAIARSIGFDSLEFHGCGNHVVATVKLADQAEINSAAPVPAAAP